MTSIDRPYNQRLNDSELADGFDQLRERIRAEIFTRLQWAWGDAIETDSLNFFRIIDRRNRWGWGRLRGDERAETFAARQFCHRAETIGSDAATQTARCGHLRQALHRTRPRRSTGPYPTG